MIEKRVQSLEKSDDQEGTQFLKMGVKERVTHFFSKLKKLMIVEHVGFEHFDDSNEFGTQFF